MGKYIVFTVLAICLLATYASADSEKEAEEAKFFVRNEDGTFTEHPELHAVHDYTQILEDTDIMAKIIDRALDKKWPKKYEPSTLFRQSLGCQGVYLKGYGFVFTTNINFPVARREEPEPEQAPVEDLWVKTKRELKGMQVTRVTANVTQGGLGGNYDDKRAGLLKEELLTLIGEYGTNIRDLDAEESVVIIVRGTSPGNMMAFNSVGSHWRNPVATELKRLRGELKQNDANMKIELMRLGVTASKIKQYQQTEEINDASKLGYKMPYMTYASKVPVDVKIKILDASGNVVRTIAQTVPQIIDMRYHEIGTPLPWDGKDEAGKEVEAGAYTCEIEVGDDTITETFILKERSKPEEMALSKPLGAATAIDVTPVGLGEPLILEGRSKSKGTYSVVNVTPSDEIGVVIKSIDTLMTAIDLKKTQELLLWSTPVYLPKPGISTGRTTLIVKVSRKDIASYKDGSLDFEAFAKKAEITQY